MYVCNASFRYFAILFINKKWAYFRINFWKVWNQRISRWFRIDFGGNSRIFFVCSVFIRYIFSYYVLINKKIAILIFNNQLKTRFNLLLQGFSYYWFYTYHKTKRLGHIWAQSSFGPLTHLGPNTFGPQLIWAPTHFWAPRKFSNFNNLISKFQNPDSS